MTALMYWARKNVWTARAIIIFLIYPVLNLCGWFIADILALNGVHITEAWGYPLSFLLLFLFLVYPFRSDRSSKHFFFWKKSMDLLMILTTFCFILMRGNNFNNDLQENMFVTSTHAAVAEKSIGAKPVVEKKKNPIKKLLNDFRKKYRSASKRDKTGMIVLVVFTAIIALTLLFLLTCSIACSGAEGLAYVVFFLGLGAIIFGLIRMIHRISKGPRKKKEPEVKSTL